MFPDHLYIAQSASDTAIKIGASNFPEARVATLSRQCRELLTVLVVRKGLGVREYDVHKLFVADRIKKTWGRPSDLSPRPPGREGQREWFRPSARLMAFVRYLRGEVDITACAGSPREMLAVFRCVASWQESAELRSLVWRDRHETRERTPNASESLRIERMTGIPAELWGVDPRRVVQNGIAESFAVGF